MKFTIRDATPSDGRFIAMNVLAAMGFDVFSGTDCQDVLDDFGKVCARPDTLYSYARTRIASVDGRPAGSLTAYPGDDYPPLRKFTWGLLDPIFGTGSRNGDEAPAVPPQEAECRPGEFYLDSLAILPEYRGMAFEYSGMNDRIGHLLMLDGIRIAGGMGYRRVSLIVDKSKPRLAAYYSALGFRPDGEILFFGHLYDRMVRDTD